jgi:hypothetical protein
LFPRVKKTTRLHFPNNLKPQLRSFWRNCQSVCGRDRNRSQVFVSHFSTVVPVLLDDTGPRAPKDSEADETGSYVWMSTHSAMLDSFV